MTHDCDFTPAKLFLCRVISTCFDASPEGKSDVCQMLYGRLQREDLRGLHEKELQFITKLGAGWEPSKNEALSFFRSTDPINELLNLIVAEWRDSISSTHSFVTWMISVQRWKDQYGLDSIEDELKELYLFVASIVASFLLLPFSALDSIVSSLLSFLRDEPAECIAFPSPLPPYRAQFSTAQRMAWVERFQSALYRSGDKFDLTALKSQLLRVTPPPRELLASVALLEDNFVEAETLLRDAFDTSSLFSLLYPLAQYTIARGYTTTAKAFLTDLERAVQKSHNHDELVISAFLHFLLYSDDASLTLCVSPHPTAFQKYALFVIMKRSLLLSRVYASLQRVFPDNELAVPERSFSSFADALSACDVTSFRDVMIQYAVREQDTISPFLSAADLQFLEGNNAFVAQVQHDLDHDRLFDAEATVRQWKQVCMASAFPEAEKDVEMVQCELYEAILANRLGWMEKAVKRIELCREKCVHGEYGLWVAICDLVLCFVMQENESSNHHYVKRLLNAASVFYRLRQKQLLQWSCLLLANGEKEKEELLKLNPKDVVFNCYLKYSLFECGLSSFSEFLGACKKAENVVLVNRLVAKKSTLIDSATVAKWSQLKEEKEPWLRLEGLIYECLLSPLCG